LRAAGCFAAAAAAGMCLLFFRPGVGHAAAPNAVPVRVIITGSEAEARDILERLQKGADFAVLAREKSTDPTSVDGGYMGVIDPATLRPELRDALGGMGPGQLSPLVKLPSGFAILKVLPPGEIPQLDEAEKERQFAISAIGSVRYSFDISGLNEVEAALATLPKPADWYEDLNGVCKLREDSRAAARQRIEQYLSPAAKAADKGRQPFDELAALEALGQLHAYQGEMDDAITEWETAYRRATTELPRAVSYLDELLGLAYLRRSEMDNGIFGAPGDRCIFPMAPGFHYAKTDDSEKAIAHLLKVAESQPNDLEVRWNLNLAYMTAGKYPDGVAKQYLLPPAIFTSEQNIGRFQDVAPRAGLKLLSMAGGIAVDDFDGDGLFDVVTSSMDQCAAMHFFHNNGDGTFSDRSEKAGLSAQLGGLNNNQADYNNDGCPDILVMRGGWEIPQRLSLLRNNCNGTFTDVTKAAGLANTAFATQATAWADINNDGLLDLFVGAENAPSHLFLNKGDGTFQDVSEAAGVGDLGWVKAVSAADYDGDGWVDFYVSNYRGDNELLRNNHDGTFTDVAKQAGVLGSGHGFGAFFFDYNNDGWPDLFVTSYYMSVDETVRTYLGLPHSAATLTLYENLGNGAFRDVTAEAGLAKSFMPMGLNFGDVDNDGYPDIYLGNGDPTFGAEVPHVLLRNDGGKRFVDITASSGTGELHKGHGIAFADMDGDGDEDIVTIIGGAVRGDAHMMRLFENPGNGNDWLGVRLLGVKANRLAIGARIKVTVTNGGQPARSIYGWVNSGGSFGASPLEQHFGLGAGARIESVEAQWPGNSSPPQVFRGVPKDHVIQIQEGSAEFKTLPRTKVRLGGKEAR